jgi:GT2 family glycosyltransferase
MASPAERIARAAATADFVLPLPLDAILTGDAPFRFSLALASAPDADILYADEDVSRCGRRSSPRLKTDWDPYFMLAGDGVGVPAMYRGQAILEADIAGLVSETADNFLHALTLAVSAVTSPERIIHIPRVLCHRRSDGDWSARQAAAHVARHLAARGQDAALTPAPSSERVNQVSGAHLIGPCLEGLLTRTDYPALEVLVIDNGTTAQDALEILRRARDDPRVRVLRDERAYNFSQLNNQCATVARGEILLLLNNDVEITHPDWLRQMVSLAARPDVGVVGAKLVYRDGRVQHGGVCVGADRGVIHKFRFAPADEPGPCGELAVLRSEWAVTGACLAIRREVYEAVGGLDEADLGVAYGDIDLCRKVAERGLAVLWTPLAQLIHHEMSSRGRPLTPHDADREASEHMRFWSRRADAYGEADPFYNPQLTHLPDGVDFAHPPRPHRFRSGPEKAKRGRSAY